MRDTYIFKKSHALNLNQCQHSIDYFENSSEQKTRTDLYNYIQVPGILHEFRDVGDILLFNIKEYGDQHYFLKKYIHPWGVESKYNMQKYLPGVSFKGEHCEHGPDEHDCRRVLGWMFYLNDIKRDGGTCWPQQNLTTKPRAGDLYIWPAGWTHSHFGIPAPEETKYILTGWCSIIQPHSRSRDFYGVHETQS